MVQLDRVSAQIDGLQQRLDAFAARRNEAIAERAGRHVASIVAAAEKSAAQIRAGAENDAAAIRERLLADVQAEVERIRTAAHADATRIRAEAHAQVARARDRAITEVGAEFQEVSSRLSDEIQRGARAAIARITGRAQPSGGTRTKQITHEVAAAVDELESAATVLEQSLRDLRGGTDDRGGHGQPSVATGDPMTASVRVRIHGG